MKIHQKSCTGKSNNQGLKEATFIQLVGGTETQIHAERHGEVQRHRTGGLTFMCGE